MYTLLHVDRDVWTRHQIAAEWQFGLITRPLLADHVTRVRLRPYHKVAVAIWPRKWHSEPDNWFTATSNPTDLALAASVSRVVWVSLGPLATSSLPNVLRHKALHRVVVNAARSPRVESALEASPEEELP